MAGKDGISLATEIKAAQENAVVILYTRVDCRSYYLLILEKRLDGILSKTASRDKIIQTIQLTM